MASSGVMVQDECVSSFQELKHGHSLRYILFKIKKPEKYILVHKTAPPSATYEDFQKELFSIQDEDDSGNPKPGSNGCIYGIFDFEYSEEGGKRNKIIFVPWVPDSSSVKSKMLYASSKDALKKKLVGIAQEIQATDKSEVDQAYVLGRIKGV